MFSIHKKTVYCRLFGLIGFVYLTISCDLLNDPKKSTIQDSWYFFQIQNLSDSKYPDNPDKGFRATQHNENLLTEGSVYINKQNATFRFFTNKGDSIVFKPTYIMEFMPIVHKDFQDTYINFVTCINQEWNRNQVQFSPEYFHSSISNVNRIDIARNCLQSYLWEVIIYVEEDGKTKTLTHGWFDFPKEPYKALFEKKNGVAFEEYKKHLEQWNDLDTKKVDLTYLREPLMKKSIRFVDSSEAMYPLKGARKKKFKNIVYPKRFETMKDLQNDSTLFATFSPPGYYNTDDPRETELGRFYHLQDVEVWKVKSKISQGNLNEFRLEFVDKQKQRKTTLLIGGIELKNIPILPREKANSGWKNSMGISNHSFYETYSTHIQQVSKNNPYYALLLDEKGRFLDSHHTGIDGPLMHFTDSEKNELHIWLLSFERHALVGHYVIWLP